MFSHLVTCFLLLAFAPVVAGSGGGLGLTVESNGRFVLTHDSIPWLEGGTVRIGDLSNTDGSLVGSPPTKSNGVDELGSYEAVTIKWAKQSQATDAILHTSFRTYKEDGGMVVFEQYFPSPLNVTDLTQGGKRNGQNLMASTIFPAFERKSAARASGLDCFSYNGVFPKIESCTLATYKETHQGGAPLVVYDSANSSLPMTVFSPLNFPKAQHMASNEQFVGAGIKATVTSIPKGYSQLFVLSASLGINDGMLSWGDRVLKFTGKPRADMYRDVTHSSIGFWTDNGGYYHYDTGVNKSKTYMDVLPKVKAYHDALGVPFRHWQFDSWFYPKDGGVNPGGGGGAVTNWTNLQSVFPDDGETDGMVEIQKKIGLPMVMHNRQWSPKSDYIKNLKFEWYVSAKAAVPKDPEAFFRWFFQQQKGWGLTMYEQDWMCTEYDEVEALQTNISMGDSWLRGMALGVESSNRTQQYCMPYPYDILSASAFPAVTNARATGDYYHVPGHLNWAIGGTSLFYWAIGILPFKDGFYSSTNKQVGGQTVGPEMSPDRECLMATLSCAMVGPMDGIHLLNKTRVMTACRSDGVILKPDKPVATSEYCFRKANPSCLLYTTHSDVSSYGRVHYFYSDSDDLLTPGMLNGNNDASEHVVYNWYTGEATMLQQTNKLLPGYENHVYSIIAPVMANGWALVGERAKYVTAAKVRFESVVAAGDSLVARVVGLKGEVVDICAVQTSALPRGLACKIVRFEKDSTATVSF
jgi:hypothetical protein